MAGPYGASVSLDLAESMVAFGLVPGITENAKFGNVTGLDAADAAAHVWAYGSDTASGTPLNAFPTVAAALYIASSSASDTDVDVTYSYIDTNGAEQTASVNLNGTTAVSLGVSGIFINRAQVSGATAAVGNITIANASGFTAGIPNDKTKVLAYIEAAAGRTEQCIYVVPLGYSMRVKRLQITGSRTSGVAGSYNVSLIVREFGGVFTSRRTLFLSTSAPYSVDTSGLVFPARAAVAMRVDDVSDTDTNITAVMSYELLAT